MDPKNIENSSTENQSEPSTKAETPSSTNLFCVTSDGSTIYEGGKRIITSNNVEVVEKCINGQLVVTRTPLTDEDIQKRIKEKLAKWML